MSTTVISTFLGGNWSRQSWQHWYTYLVDIAHAVDLPEHVVGGRRQFEGLGEWQSVEDAADARVGPVGLKEVALRSVALEGKIAWTMASKGTAQLCDDKFYNC